MLTPNTLLKKDFSHLCDFVFKTIRINFYIKKLYMPFKIVKLGSVWKIRKTYPVGDKRKNHYINKQFKTRDSAIKVAKGYVRFRKGRPVVDHKNNIVRAAV